MRCLIALLLLTAIPAYAEDIGNNTVCFVPGPDDCAMVAVAEINKAQRTLDVEQFQLTEPHIGQAVIDAKNRGVVVRVIVDKKAPGEKNGQTPTIAAAGIPVWVDSKPHIAHNKGCDRGFNYSNRR
jgi:phosphatidylserine/phosphatidylglycerophosphate/cardiolipin synthase-like enzyme